jgi:MFS family permease
MIGAIIGSVTFGYLSDRIGRRRSIVLALVLAILMIPLWAFSPSLTGLVIGAFAMQFMVQGAWGVIPAHITELSPDSVRGFLPGFAYQCGVLIASSVAFLEATLATRRLPRIDGDGRSAVFPRQRGQHGWGRKSAVEFGIVEMPGPRSPGCTAQADSISFALAAGPSAAFPCSAPVLGFIIVTRNTGRPPSTVAVIQPVPSRL